MDFQTYHFRIGKIADEIQSIESNYEKIKYLQWLKIEINTTVRSINSTIRNLKSPKIFGLCLPFDRAIHENIKNRIRYEEDFVKNEFIKYFETWYNHSGYEYLDYSLAKILLDKIQSELNSGYVTNITNSHDRWYKEKYEQSEKDDDYTVFIKYAKFYLQKYEYFHPYQNDETDEIVARLYADTIIEHFKRNILEINEIQELVDRKLEYYQNLTDLEDQEKSDHSKNTVKSPHKHRERQRIKEKGIEIKKRNPSFTDEDIARQLKKLQPFNNKSVDTLRKYYSQPYWYNGKEYK